MKDVQKVAEDLYFIEQPLRPGWFVGVSVVLGSEKIGLVDTGFERTPEERIFPTLRNMGRKPEEINCVVNTHRDGDHVLGNSVIKKETGAKITVHELDAEAVETVDIKLKDGDFIDLGDRSFRVVHTPGHTLGSICLYDQENSALITGDSVCGERSDLIRMNKEIYIVSLRKLLDLKVEVMIMSHPFLPIGKSVLTGDECERMIRASMSVAEKLR